jgi:hypothetical protein
LRVNIDPDLTTERMRECLCRWQEAGDGRAIFLGCYALMTDNMVAAVRAGEFRDPAWVKHLLVHFAGYYFAALDAWDAGDASLPPVWRCAYEVACQPDASALQQLLLGVSAHINYDLVLATADLLEGEWHAMEDAEREARRADFDQVNLIIATTIDEVQDTILEPAAPILGIVDAALGPIDEWMIAGQVRRWRNEVWAEAIRRVGLIDPFEREAHRQQIEAAALQWAQRLGARL